MEITNIGLIPMIDASQREELLELVRHAPATDLGMWLKQVLPENGGYGHVRSHQDESLVALVSTMAASINELRGRVEELEEARDAAVSEPSRA
jgi:hypothetical protein